MATLGKREYRLQAIEAFTKMNEIKQKMYQLMLVDEASYPVWVPGDDLTVPQMRSMAFDAITGFHYHDAEKAHKTRILPGLIAVSPKVLTLAKRMNVQKARFKQAMVAIRKAGQEGVLSDLEKSFKQQSYVRDDQQSAVLNRGGLGRVNLLQAYRHIPFCEYRPLSVSFNPCQNITVKKTTLGDVHQIITKQHEHAPEESSRKVRLSDDLKKMAGLAKTTPLAIRRVYGKRWMTRAMTPDNVPDEYPGHTPLLIPHKTNKPLPTFRPVTGDLEKDGYNRLERVDRRVAREPLIESLPVYMYQDVA